MFVYTKDEKIYLGKYMGFYSQVCGTKMVVFLPASGLLDERKSSKVHIVPDLLPEPLEDI